MQQARVRVREIRSASYAPYRGVSVMNERGVVGLPCAVRGGQALYGAHGACVMGSRVGRHWAGVLMERLGDVRYTLGFQGGVWVHGFVADEDWSPSVRKSQYRRTVAITLVQHLGCTTALGGGVRPAGGLAPGKANSRKSEPRSMWDSTCRNSHTFSRDKTYDCFHG